MACRYRYIHRHSSILKAGCFLWCMSSVEVLFAVHQWTGCYQSFHLCCQESLSMILLLLLWQWNFVFLFFRAQLCSTCVSEHNKRDGGVMCETSVQKKIHEDVHPKFFIMSVFLKILSLVRPDWLCFMPPELWIQLCHTHTVIHCFNVKLRF